MIDQLPNLILLFRLDEQDDAHLIFCNNKINSQLGYTAKEYVMEFESNDEIHTEIQSLINEVARRSHDVDSTIEPKPCSLSHKNGHPVRFRFNYNLFKTRSAQTNLIAVELKPEKQLLAEAEQDQETGSQYPEKPQQGQGSQAAITDFYVSASPISQQVEKKTKNALENPMNVLFQGEAGVGKSTLAKRLSEQLKERYSLPVIDYKEVDDELAIDDEVSIILLIKRIDKLGEKKQKQLRQLLERGGGDQLYIIATAEQALEALIGEQFDTELFYMLSFYTILIPPLRHRKEDITEAADKYLQNAVEVLKLNNITWDDHWLQRLVEYPWKGNFDELFEALRLSLLQATGQKLPLVLPGTEKIKRQEWNQLSQEEVVSFDEMNRRYLSHILEITNGKIYGEGGAAELLDLKPTTLQSKLKKLGIK